MGHFRKNLISLFLNSYCNMRCIYCPLHGQHGFYELQRRILQEGLYSQPVIDLDFAKCGIKDFFEQTGSHRIRLFSNGEAMLAFNVVREITEYAYSLAAEDLYVELQTNGYFGKGVAEWICGNVHMVWVSLDGPADIQNHNRPGVNDSPTFDVVDRNIRLIQRDGRTTVGIRATVSDYSIDRQSEIIDYAKHNGIATVYAYPWVSFLGKKEGMPDLMDFARAYLRAREYGEKAGVYYGTVFMINFDEEVEINCRALLPAPHLTPDGYVTACDMQNTGDGLLEELVFGRWDAERRKIEYFPERIEKIRSRNIYSLEECRDCPALKHCAGGCVGAGMIATGLDLYGINSEYCRVTRFLFEHLPHLVNVGYDPNLPLHP